MKIPIREWTCSQHKYPDQCESCETWHCEECRGSKWITIGERDASFWEEKILALNTVHPAFRRD